MEMDGDQAQPRPKLRTTADCSLVRYGVPASPTPLCDEAAAAHRECLCGQPAQGAADSERAKCKIVAQRPQSPRSQQDSGGAGMEPRYPRSALSASACGPCWA